MLLIKISENPQFLIKFRNSSPGLSSFKNKNNNYFENFCHKFALMKFTYLMIKKNLMYIAKNK